MIFASHVCRLFGINDATRQRYGKFGSGVVLLPLTKQKAACTQGSGELQPSVPVHSVGLTFEVINLTLPGNLCEVTSTPHTWSPQLPSD